MNQHHQDLAHIKIKKVISHLQAQTVHKHT